MWPDEPAAAVAGPRAAQAGRSSGRGDQTVPDRARGEFRATARVELLEDVAEMELDGVLADPELGRDLLVAQAARHEREDIELALGQPIRIRPAGAAPRHRVEALPATELLDDPDRRRRTDRGLAATDRLEHGPQLRRLEVLEQVALGTGLDRLEEVILVLGDGEDDDGDRRLGRLDPRRRREPGPARHADVHEHQVRPDLGGQRDRLVLAAGEPHDIVAPRPDERRDPVAEEGVVVGDEDPHRGRLDRRGGRPRRGARPAPRSCPPRARSSS